MNRSQIIGRLVAGLAVLSVAIVWPSVAFAGGKSLESESKVKRSATATKPNDKGEQVVTITLDIDKGWHLYANPINSNEEFLAKNRTMIKIASKVKLVAVDVQYPPGTKHVDGKSYYDIYEGRVTIKANVQRAAGDTSPLEITLEVNACDENVCLKRSEIKLMIP
jgi:DsbC/DsbD-like thiol-disulfide interchange protein